MWCHCGRCRRVYPSLSQVGHNAWCNRATGDPIHPCFPVLRSVAFSTPWAEKRHYRRLTLRAERPTAPALDTFRNANSSFTRTPFWQRPNGDLQVIASLVRAAISVIEFSRSPVCGCVASPRRLGRSVFLNTRFHSFGKGSDFPAPDSKGKELSHA